ncbi:zinc-ribbon domain-containing protein [Spirulina subsalsa FACHB-351]|uniref:Zinc-ribbon domain-containing protein n=1 Tax=Spirulina subsalsa FACHB-351 TaxID=234711 RepID=A0ABT3L3W1_9CYAN|nr:tubulin-like doman-containing protein [Spirulina subsalsa]MCW6036186.1 zinc-ribbon domain-containing protein [Spirulina subsalsa FACHB-351]
MVAVEEKSMVPTVIIGIGGTGAEVAARVRRLVEETYGNLKNFPIISFLLVDTDKDYKITEPEAAGSPFKDNEKHWARVSGKVVRDIVSDMSNFPWINSWFPSELERNISSLEAGAGQIRACGRFALFCNYAEIQSKFLEAVRRTKGHENFMQDRYGIKVNTSGINVFLTGSLSGGTGSGMILDLGYCIRNWLKGESSPIVTAIVPMPSAFAGISVGDRVLANGYAAMMEFSYFADYRTEYVAQFSRQLSDEVRSKLPPFDFTYLVGTKNGESDFKLAQIREIIAQNIFLDLTSEFSPHKRSIRDNIKGAWAQADPGGRGYPKNFMSFGLSTIEIPIAHIRGSLSSRLAQDFIGWWQNEQALLPPQMLDFVRGDILKRLRLSEIELITDLSAAQDRPYLTVIAEWINQIRQEIINENWLQCTQQGVNVLAAERGKILNFLNGYLKPKVDEYERDHFRELSPDERLHGDFWGRMYDNRDQAIVRGRQVLEEELYRILEDRTQGPKFAESFLLTTRQIFTDLSEKFRNQEERIWQPNEIKSQQQYEKALADLNEFKDKFGISKQSKMEEFCQGALTGLEGYFVAKIQRKTRALAREVLARLQDHLTGLERRFNRLQQRLTTLRDFFQEEADRQADRADALQINGIKLFDRQELNGLYQDFIERHAGATQGSKTAYELGMDGLCSTLSGDILQQLSPLWKATRRADEIMRLLDLIEIPDVQDEDIREMIGDRTKQVILNAPAGSKMQQDLAACDRLLKKYNDDQEIINNIRIAYNKSKPLILMDKAVLGGQDAGFTPALNTNVALLGGRNTPDPAAQKLLPKIKEFVGNDDDIKPLGDVERHRIVFVQETGGFSLRCIDGMKELRQSYQDWKSEFILAKRAQQRGEYKDLPIPVHIQKEPPFWDIFPEDVKIYELVVEARSLGILRLETNRTTGENVVRYTKQTAIGAENVDIASSWAEAPQVLEVKACRDDREAIQTQVNSRLVGAETDNQKQALFSQLTDYLEQRAIELDKDGGKDSPEYKRESFIILNLIQTYKLNPGLSAGEVIDPPAPPIETAPIQDTPKSLIHVFCTQCGAQNPLESNFCFKCGGKLTK